MESPADLLGQSVNLDDFEEAAGSVLPRMVFDYYQGGALDEITLGRNRAAWGEITLRYRVLRDVSKRTMATSVLGMDTASPVLFAPTAFHKLAHPEGERETARAAHALDTVMTLSTLSNIPMEEVCVEHDKVWFQLYVYRDRGLTRDLVARAEAAGAKAIVLTVDAQMWGRRERDVRNRFHLPEGLQVANALPGGHGAMPETAGESGLAAYVAQLFDLELSWRDLEMLRGLTPLPLVVKGRSIRTTPSSPSRTEPTPLLCRTTVAASWTRRQRPPRPCRRWWRRSTAGSRCWSTAASAAAPTSSRRWPWGHRRCRSAARCCGVWRSVASRGSCRRWGACCARSTRGWRSVG
jgi:hypothetical protein